jgi:hypothetical protein
MLVSLVLSVALSTSLYAKLEGVPFIDLTVQGVTYEVPIYNPKVENMFYHLKKAIEYDDKVSREILLGKSEQRIIFIGDGDKVLWLKLTKDGQEVKEQF